MDQNCLCLERYNKTLPICCLPGYFKPTTPAIQHENLVCIGGESGLTALINLDRLTIPDHYLLASFFTPCSSLEYSQAVT